MQFKTLLKPKLIYVFRINDAEHQGCLKVGEATCHEDNALGLLPNCRALNQAARERINQYTQTAGIAYELLYTELTLFVSDGHFCSFNDKEVNHGKTKSATLEKRNVIFWCKNEMQQNTEKATRKSGFYHVQTAFEQHSKEQYI